MWELKIILGQFALKKIATPDNFPLDDCSPDNYNRGELPPPLLPCLPNGQFPQTKLPHKKTPPRINCRHPSKFPRAIAFYVNSTSTILY